MKKMKEPVMRSGAQGGGDMGGGIMSLMRGVPKPPATAGAPMGKRKAMMMRSMKR